MVAKCYHSADIILDQAGEGLVIGGGNAGLQPVTVGGGQQAGVNIKDQFGGVTALPKDGKAALVAAQQVAGGAFGLLRGLRLLPVLLGDNVGTTITAILAAAGGTRDAKRAAAAHCCFNLSGSLVCLLALPWFVRLVELLPPEGEELEIITRQIANAHTLFNALCTLIWLPLTPLMVRLVTTLVPEKRTE